MEFVIRDYTPNDFNNVNSLWQETGLGGSVRGDNAPIINDSIKIGGKLLLMEEKISKTLIGTSWMTFDGRRIHWHHFGIMPTYQNMGYGKLLAKESLKFAKEKGCQIKLEVSQKNKNAINLYKNIGFNYLGDYDIYIIRDIKNLMI